MPGFPSTPIFSDRLLPIVARPGNECEIFNVRVGLPAWHEHSQIPPIEEHAKQLEPLRPAAARIEELSHSQHGGHAAFDHIGVWCVSLKHRVGIGQLSPAVGKPL
jgi:hypothetical protein